MSPFVVFIQLPSGLRNPTAIVAACRAGAVGVVNAELESNSARILHELEYVATHATRAFGLRLDANALATAVPDPALLHEAPLHEALSRDSSDEVSSLDALNSDLAQRLSTFVDRGLKWLIADGELLAHASQIGNDLFDRLRQLGVRVLIQARTRTWPAGVSEQSVDGLILKGHEAGGLVGEDSSFVLVQHWRRATQLPIYVHGGLTPAVAAACSAIGVAGGMFDSQVLLFNELQAPESHRALFASLSGGETTAVGDAEYGEYFRLLVRPGHSAARAFVAEQAGQRSRVLRLAAYDKTNWEDLRSGLIPVGQDICFAAVFSKRYRSLSALVAAVEEAVRVNLKTAVEAQTVSQGAPLSEALGIELPIIQGPMTRVSDSPQFARAVAEHGALPMVAFALLSGDALERLLVETTRLLENRPWGIGLLGFAPQALLDEQLQAALRFSPRYAIIAGGRPDQAVALEKAGIPSFLHVPNANLIPLFLAEGARRFIFEGRECGGHVGPLCSFVLWSTMVDRVLLELSSSSIDPKDVQLIFAGGIHDSASSAAVQVLVAPLVARGVRVGILMGSAYLFTREIVESGAIVPGFQSEVVDCDRTVNLESGPGHASRCGYTPFAREFFRVQQQMKREGAPAEDVRKALDDLIMGRLRIASKGTARRVGDGQLEALDEARQREEGMYMLGQVATLRSQITDIGALHVEVSTHASALLEARLAELETHYPQAAASAPVDVAIVGIGALLPGANSVTDYWDNILARVDAITEIPRHRWDYRLYFDEDRHAPDKVYSKWGGFLDDLLFDPARYGMPPRSVESVDPMQLIALEVAQRTLVDSGYDQKPFNRERASVIIGASGGNGDVGIQYGLRAELPRFTGDLPESVASQLPKWTEDSFAGILNNVTAGRIANRLDFGGVNFTTDAACASSLAAVYQGVTELVAGRSDLVIAGGVDTVQGPFGYLCFSKTQALSPRGRCSSFDAASDGIVISEGVAMVALKRLADAERDGDRVYAVIKGVGASSDGRARGMTAPLPAGQMRAMRRAYAQAGFSANTVGLFEAHGTGTVAGDTAELESTTQLLRESGAHPHQATIGSVKTMIGHTKATAGIAGMIKAALALNHRVLPPHRNVTVPNAVLRKEDCPVQLVARAEPWLAKATAPRRAAVSAFGFGGTNFHIVMEEYTREYRSWMRAPVARRWNAELFVLKAADREALAVDVKQLEAALAIQTDATLADVAAALVRRQASNSAASAVEILSFVARDFADARTKLSQARAHLADASQKLPAFVHLGSAHGTNGQARGKLAILFPGQGSQYPGMLRELLLHFPVCSETLATADELLRDAFESRFGSGATLGRFIFPPACYDEVANQRAAVALTQTDVAQPALGAVSAAAYRLLSELGVKPDLVAGHSFGEFVALYAAGSIDLPSLLDLAAARGRFIVDASRASGAELGTMAAVHAERTRVEAIIQDVPDVLVANHNAPTQCILSGTREGITQAIAKLSAAGLSVSEIPVAAAFHSPLVAPAQAALSERIAATRFSLPTCPVYANATAEPHAQDVDAIRASLAAHLVRPVEFVAEIEAMYRDGARIFLELGPKPVLSKLTRKILGAREHVAIALDSASEETGGLFGLLDVLAQLSVLGVELDLSPLFQQRATPVADPFALPARPKAPGTAFWINGSGVRRADEAPKQVGLTQEQVVALAAMGTGPIRNQAPAVVASSSPLPDSAPFPAVASLNAPAAFVPSTAIPPTAMPAAGPSSNVAFSNPTSPVNPQPRWLTMNDHDPRRVRPPVGDSTTIAQYFDTMRQFLETQERVMALLVGAQVPTLQSNRAPRSQLVAASPVPAFAATPAPYAAPAAAAPMPVTPMPVAPAAPPAAVAPVMVAPAAPAPVVITLPVAVVSAPSVTAPLATAAHAKNGNGHSNGHSNSSAPNGSGANGSRAPQLDRAALTEMLLSIVEEKTGYPRDMVGLTQNLEADLGIDSIKRIEVVGAMMLQLPEKHRELLADSRGKLNTQPTLEGMLKILTSVSANGEAAHPFDVAGVGSEAVIGHLPRHILLEEEQAIPADAAFELHAGTYLVTEDALGVALALEQRLVERGCSVVRLPSEALLEEAALLAWIQAHPFAAEPLAGIVHLAPISHPGSALDASPEVWRQQLFANEKALFLLVNAYDARLAECGHVLSASALGGYFARKPAPSTAAFRLHLQAGAVGLLKSYLEERPTLRVKVVDLDATSATTELCDALFAELTLGGGRQEVGYPGGRRTIVRTELTDVQTDVARAVELQNLVVLATGGGRGITAELLREVATTGNTLILTGRSPLVEIEAQEIASCITPDELRRYFIAQVKSGARTLTPAQIGREVSAILAAREMRNNLADFRARGAHVEYHAVDVTDEPSLSALVKDVEARCGAISGVVHGAGIIEDKRVADKTSDSWSRVVETKVLGALLLQKYVRAETLRFFVMMSSVAGRYGNSGQADYATGNELLNRICCQLQAHWQGRVNVMALCWGPWGSTLFGAGMVNEQTEAKFAEKGVFLVSAEVGRQLFIDELSRRDRGLVEIICGTGPWEARETALGAIHRRARSYERGPLLGAATVQVTPKGDHIVTFTLDRDHEYLSAHCVDGVPVLPAAAAAELFAEAGASTWPAWKLLEVRECRLLKGVELKADERALTIIVSPPMYGSSEGFEVTAILQSDAIEGRPAQQHYRAVLRFGQTLPESFRFNMPRHDERQLSVPQAYSEWLFHGPCFQVIENIAGLSGSGMSGVVRATSPNEWLPTVSTAARWWFDPAVVDAAPQLAILWARVFRDETALPTRFGRIARYCETLPARMRVVFECIPSPDPSEVAANVYYLDENEQVVLLIEDMHCVSSAALNRLSQHRTKAVAALRATT